MTDEPIDPELDRLFDLLAEEERGEPDPVEHPSATTLSAYHVRTLPDDQVPGVQEHLVACRLCRDQLLEHIQFMGSPTESLADNVSSLEMATEWRRLRERLPADPVAVLREVDQGRQPRTGRLWGSLGAAYSLAAVLAIALAGVSLVAGSLLKDLKRPVAVQESEPLMARGSQRSSSPRPQSVWLPASLPIEVSSPQSFPEYQADFKDEHGGLVWSVKARMIQEEGNIRLFLPKHCLEPGYYQVIVWGLRGDAREQLGVYDVHIVA